MLLNLRFLAFFLFILSFPAGQVLAAAEKDGVPRYVTTNVIPEKDAIAAGETLAIAIQQIHAPEWHTYWKNPGDSGESTSISWTLPEGFKAGELEYPAPHKIPYGPLMNYGFSGETVLLTSITAPDHLQGGEVTLTADISWLVCRDICVPEFTKATLVLPVATAESPAHDNDPEFFTKARAALPQSVVWQGMLEEQDQTLKLTFKPEELSLAELSHSSDMFFFPEEWGILLNPALQQFTVENDHLVITVQRDTRPLSDIKTLKGVIRYTTVERTDKAVAISMAVTASTPSAAQSQTTTAPIAPSPEEEVTIVQAIVLAILGGLILNLMPCVFPVLSMKALSLVKMSAREQKHATLHGLFYTVGILVCFASIAGVLISLKAAGEEIGWGFQFQNPVVVLLLAYLLFVMALNLSGFFEFKGHLFSNIGHKLAAHHGYAGTFFTGMLATIVATPCTAPFMGTAMGFALTQPDIIALSVFLALGLGLALPYLALCFIPSLRHSLPKPGAWMETFRQFMSFPLYASVAWLVWVYAQLVSGDYGVLLSLTGIILIAFSVWITRHTPTKQPWKTGIHALSYSAIILALMIAVLSIMKPPEEVAAANGVNGHSLDYTAYTKQAYDDAIKGDKAVFINMTAAWCITCKVNDKIALSTDSTKALFAEKDIVYLQGDWTNSNPEITEFLNSYGRSGVPLYVYIGPRDTTSGDRPVPQVLPQILTSGLVADVINGVD